MGKYVVLPFGRSLLATLILAAWPAAAELPIRPGVYAADPRACPTEDFDALVAAFGPSAWTMRVEIQAGLLIFPDNPCEVRAETPTTDGGIDLDLMCLAEGLPNPRQSRISQILPASFLLDGLAFSACDAAMETTGTKADAPVTPAPATPTASASDQKILAEVRALYAGVADGSAADRRGTLQKVRALLDRIVTEYPDSETALMIVLQMPIDGIDIAAIDQELAAPPAAAALTADAAQGEQPAPSVAENPEPAAMPAVPASPATEATEKALALDEQGWRDVQARLLVLGFDPNGIDGKPGRGTRSALTEWQAVTGLPASGFLSADHVQRLVAGSQAALDLWLLDEENQLLLTPPPPIELTASNVNGSWSFRATCGKNSAFPGQTITGTMEISLARDRSIKGSVRNSQGFNGRVTGQVSGRRMSGVINWGLLLGRVSFAGNIASQSLSFSGDDSNGCRLRASKG